MTIADELAELHERHMNSANHIEVRGYAIFALKEKLICNLPEIIAALRARDAAATHIRAQSAEIERLKMGLAMYASDMAQFDSSKTRTALKEPGA